MSSAVAPCRTIRRYPSIQEKQSFSSRSAASGEEKTSFATPDVASALFEAVRFYERKQQWFIHLLVLMPDHVHFLASFAMGCRDERYCGALETIHVDTRKNSLAR
jgi:hypothetical protein